MAKTTWGMHSQVFRADELTLVHRGPAEAPLLSIGDKVRLWSGGPVMLVKALSVRYDHSRECDAVVASCEWDGGADSFSAICLTVVEKCGEPS